MDIEAKIEELTAKLKEDETLQEQFKKDYAQTIKDLVGADLPEEQVKQIMEGIVGMFMLEALGGMFGKTK